MVQFHNSIAAEESRPATARAGATRPLSSPASCGRRVCFSFAAYARSVIDHLKRCQVPIARGLSDEEFRAIEGSFGFAFPPDLRSILSEGLPVGVGFPNWRSGARQQLQMMVDLPMAALSYDIANGRFWCGGWPARPSSSRDALRIARHELSRVPLLIPIYTHCYIPCSPCLAGNPVFFIYQTHFYYCGYDVSDFFQREAFVPHTFNTVRHPATPSAASRIRDLIDTHFDAAAAVPTKFSDKDDTAKKCPAPKSCRKSVSDASPRTGESAMVASAYTTYFQQKPLSAKALSRFTIEAPSWAAKTARKIHFWSDLVERKQIVNVAAAASPDGVFSSIKVEIDISAKSSSRCKKVRWEDLAVADMNGKQWVNSYLNDLQFVLRNGGWKDEDISDIINAAGSSSSPRLTKNQIHKQMSVENLALRFESLSASLRKGGWSATDIVECFGLDHNAGAPNFQGSNSQLNFSGENLKQSLD